jgi:hypothetical protein
MRRKKDVSLGVVGDDLRRGQNITGARLVVVVRGIPNDAASRVPISGGAEEMAVVSEGTNIYPSAHRPPD